MLPPCYQHVESDTMPFSRGSLQWPTMLLSCLGNLQTGTLRACHAGCDERNVTQRGLDNYPGAVYLLRARCAHAVRAALMFCCAMPTLLMLCFQVLPTTLGSMILGVSPTTNMTQVCMNIFSQLSLTPLNLFFLLLEFGFCSQN